MNIQVLGRVLVVHVHGHVKFHAAHQIHQLNERVQIHQHIAVHFKAQGLGQLGFQGIHALLAPACAAENAVDLGHGVAAADQRIPGDTQQSHRVVLHIQTADHDGVRPPAVIVGADDQNVVKIGFVTGRNLCFHRDLAAGLLIHFGLNFNDRRRRKGFLRRFRGAVRCRQVVGLADFHRPDKGLINRNHSAAQHRQTDCQQDKPPLQAGQTARNSSAGTRRSRSLSKHRRVPFIAE